MNLIRLILCLILLAIACHCRPISKAHPILGSYDLKAYDNSGQRVFTGSIRLETIEQTHLKARCTIIKEKNAPVYVFDQSTGCEDLLEGKAIGFDLAPQMDDGGMLFEGEFVGERINGVRKMDGFVTSGALGPFQAVKTRS